MLTKWNKVFINIIIIAISQYANNVDITFRQLPFDNVLRTRGSTLLVLLCKYYDKIP
jgi:hypothetical protein